MQLIRYIISGWMFLLPLLAGAQDTLVKKTCAECHTKIVTRQFMHKPATEGCDKCHQSNGKSHPVKGEKGFTLTDKQPKLCYSCHAPVNEQKTVHYPVKQGHCQYCHDSHGSKLKNMLVSSSPDLCFVCHSALEKKVDTSTVVHSILKNSISCSNCHSPHQSNEPKLLQKAEKDLCFKCHDKTIKWKQRIIGNVKRELNNNPFIHGAIAKNGCGGCHDPHASAQKNLLKDVFSTTNYISGKSNDEVALCFKCHKPELLAKQETTDATGFRNKSQNLHFVHVNKSKGRNCINCHGIHSGPNDFLLLNKVKFGQWEMPMKYTRQPQGGTCITSCHVPKSYAR